MPKKNYESKTEQKQQLGAMIALSRGKRSLREIARAIEIPASNLSYIEKGINAPSPIVYEKIILELAPSDKLRQKMDTLYCSIRELPPPDVCEILIANSELINSLRMIGNKHIPNEMLLQINKLFASL